MESIKINKNYIQVNRIKACAVVMVMLIHFIGFGGFWENKNKNLYMILGLMINVLIVNCVPFFYMLTGYLDKTYTYDKVLKKILMIISVYLLYCIPVILVYRFQYNDVSWTVERYISCVLRIDAINNREGFIRGYIIMMLIAPLINQYFDKTTINSIRKITFSSLFIFSIGEVLEYWFHCSLFITAPAKYTNAIMFFIIGNWLSRENLKSMKYKCAIGMIGAFIINVIVFFYAKDLNGGYFFQYHRIGTVIASTCILGYLLSIDIEKQNFIDKAFNIIANSSLDCYLGALALEYLFLIYKLRVFLFISKIFSYYSLI